MTLTYDTTPTRLLTIAQYAQATGKSTKTINRYLKDGELPGSTKDEKGRWLIPADAERTPAPAADVVALHGRPMTRPMTVTQDSEALPSFLSVDQAAHLLGISTYAIRKHRDWFDAQPFGPHGSLVVPLATIRKVRGA